VEACWLENLRKKILQPDHISTMEGQFDRRSRKPAVGNTPAGGDLMECVAWIGRMSVAAKGSKTHWNGPERGDGRAKGGNDNGKNFYNRMDSLEEKHLSGQG